MKLPLKSFRVIKTLLISLFVFLFLLFKGDEFILFPIISYYSFPVKISDKIIVKDIKIGDYYDYIIVTIENKSDKTIVFGNKDNPIINYGNRGRRCYQTQDITLETKSFAISYKFTSSREEIQVEAQSMTSFILKKNDLIIGKIPSEKNADFVSYNHEFYYFKLGHREYFDTFKLKKSFTNFKNE